MPTVEAKERIERQLQEAIDRLRADLVRVEIWASALHGFARPIPDYQPSDDMTRHLLRRSEAESPVERNEPPAAPAPPRSRH